MFFLFYFSHSFCYSSLRVAPLLVNVPCRCRGGGGGEWEMQIFGVSEGDQVQLQFPGPDAFAPEDDFRSGVLEVSVGRALAVSWSGRGGVCLQPSQANLFQLGPDESLAVVQSEQGAQCPGFILQNCALGGRFSFYPISPCGLDDEAQRRAQLVLDVDSDFTCELLNLFLQIPLESWSTPSIFRCCPLPSEILGWWSIISGSAGHLLVSQCCNGDVVIIRLFPFLLLHVDCIHFKFVKFSTTWDQSSFQISCDAIMILEFSRFSAAATLFLGCNGIDSEGKHLLSVKFEASAPFCLMAFDHINGTDACYLDHDILTSYSCAKSYWPDDTHGEVAIPGARVDPPAVNDYTSVLVPQIQQLGFWRLSSVRDIQYLQLNSFLPQTQMPDRPSGEPPAGHQLVWSVEAFGGCSCGTFGSELSTDGRSPCGSFCSLQRPLYVLSSLCAMCFSLPVSCSSLSCHDVLCA